MLRTIKYNKVRNFSDLSFPIKKSENKIYKFEKKVCENDLLILEKIYCFYFLFFLTFHFLLLISFRAIFPKLTKIQRKPQCFPNKFILISCRRNTSTTVQHLLAEVLGSRKQ